MVLTYVASDRAWTAKLLFRDGNVTLLRWGSAVNPRLGFSTDWQSPPRNAPVPHRLYRLAVGIEPQDRIVSGGRMTSTSVPLWPAIAVTAIPPAIGLWRKRQQRARGFPVEVTQDA